MKALIPALIAGSLIYVGIVSFTTAQEPPPEPTFPITALEADVDGSGKIDAIDLMLVARYVGQEVPANPCIPYEFYATPRVLSADGTPFYLYANYGMPYDHPLRAAYDHGTPIPFRPC